MKKIIKSTLTIVLVVLLIIQGYSQKVRIIKDKDVVTKSPSEEQLEGIDCSYYVLNSEMKDDWGYSQKKNYDFSNDWVIYEDKLKINKVAYSKVNRDTCKIIQLWSDSLIKSNEIYIKGILTKYEWYCENGQLISRGDYSTPQNDTIYYCNGKLMMLYNCDSDYVIYYYESGKVMLKGIRDYNYLRPETFWVHYDENGNVIWYKYYKYGELIYSGNNCPEWLREK